VTPIARESLAPSLAPFGHSSTLPAEAYTDESVFRWEQDRLFDQSWVCVGRADGLQDAGDQRAFSLGRESVLLVRGEDGDLRAFYNVCRHRGHELLPVGGEACGKFVRCPPRVGTVRVPSRPAKTPSTSSSRWSPTVI